MLAYNALVSVKTRKKSLDMSPLTLASSVGVEHHKVRIKLSQIAWMTLQPIPKFAAHWVCLSV